MDVVKELENKLAAEAESNGQSVEGKPLHMPYEQWLTEFGEDAHTEWIKGEVLVFMPPYEIHQEFVTFLATLLENYVRHFELGKVLVAPFEMKLTLASQSREPDILFVANEHLDRLTGKKLEGAADLIIEVISPESVYRDRSDKFDEYESAGVREYWLIDSRPGRNQATFWSLDGAGHYRAGSVSDDGIYHSTILDGFWLNVNWLWMTKKPSPIVLFAEIAHMPPDVIEFLRKFQAK